MTKPTKSPRYVMLNVERPSREAISALAYALTGKASRRITQSQAIRAACEIATRHLDETAETLGDEPES